MELNREQIIKALECCGTPKLTKCKACPRDEEDALCMYRLYADALSLINELTEENERLRESNAGFALAHLFDTSPNGDCWNDVINHAKADTVRKMQENLTRFFANDDTLTYIEVDADYINEQINRIAEEIIKGENNGK